MNEKDFERIENIIRENSDNYIENAFALDRTESEKNNCFMIKCGNFNRYIYFESVEQFKSWIES